MNDLSVFPFDGSTVSGPRRVAQNVMKRLVTPRGALLDAPSYGSDLRAYLSVANPERVRFEVSQVARAEALKEPEVLDTEVTVEAPGNALLISVALVLRDERLELVLSVTPEQVTVDLYDPVPLLRGLYA